MTLSLTGFTLLSLLLLRTSHINHKLVVFFTFFLSMKSFFKVQKNDWRFWQSDRSLCLNDWSFCENDRYLTWNDPRKAKSYFKWFKSLNPLNGFHFRRLFQNLSNLLKKTLLGILILIFNPDTSLSFFGTGCIALKWRILSSEKA